MHPTDVLHNLRNTLLGIADRQERLRRVAAAIKTALGCDRVILSFDTEELKECIRVGTDAELVPFAPRLFRGVALFLGDTLAPTASPLARTALAPQGILSIAIVPIQSSLGQGYIECHFISHYHRWRPEERELCLDAAAICAEVLDEEPSTTPPERPAASIVETPAEVPPVSTTLVDAASLVHSPLYDLARFGNITVVRTDAAFSVIEVFGHTEEVLGVQPAELMQDRLIWLRLVHPDDRRLFIERARELARSPRSFDTELRIVHQRSHDVRWIHMRALPITGDDGKLNGWHGFGLDVTERYRTQEQLVIQTRRLEALYEVSRSAHMTTDPAVVALKGLAALVRATNADAGVSCFYDAPESRLEIVAAEGLSSEYLDGLAQAMRTGTLLRQSVVEKRGIFVSDLQHDTRAASELARHEGLRAAIVVPLVMEQSVLGAMCVFSRKSARFSQADFDLATAVAQHIALVARQAEYYANERRQSTSLSVLYRLSHELSKHLTPRDVAEHAFPILQEELAAKRMWLGILNEQGTYLVGQAGVGPGVRDSVIQLQIDLGVRHDFLDEALRSKQPVVVDPTKPMECSGLQRVLARLSVGSFVIVPLVALNQVVGILAVEPAVPSTFFAQKKLPLLSTMAGEIATVILARRFEARIAESEKMRMASLLASGIAHNFNNLLQAVMGQASLIEMQLPQESPLRSASRMIIDAAGRGASLVKQLLSFTVQSPGTKKSEDIARILVESGDLYRSLLGPSITFDMQLSEPEFTAEVDYAELQQAITNILINAKEAIGNQQQGKVGLRTQVVQVRSGELDPAIVPGEYLRIDIEDNGPGMDKERQQRCFEPFFTTKNVDAGTGLGFTGAGLGLSSAYSAIRRHGGVITVHSELGKGSVFSLFLPRLISMGRDNGRPIRGESPDAFLVGFNEGFGEPLRRLLATRGVAVRWVRAGEPVPHATAELLQRSQVVFVDGELTPYDLLRLRDRLKSLSASQRVVVLSSDGGLKEELKSILGARVLVREKPSGIWGLNKLVEELFAVAGAASHLQIEKVADADPGGAQATASDSGHKEPRPL